MMYTLCVTLSLSIWNPLDRHEEDIPLEEEEIEGLVEQGPGRV